MRSLALLALIALLPACAGHAGPDCSTERGSPDDPFVQALALPGSGEGGKLNVGFLIVDGVYNTELTAPMDIFHHTVFHDDVGMAVFTVAPSLDPVTSFEGLRLLPDHTYVDHPPVDILVVPSAEHSMDTDLEDQALIAWVAETAAGARAVMSLCDGAFVLAAAGLLDGQHATTFPEDIARMREMFPEVEVHEGHSFVHDGRMITSFGGASSFEPALYVVERLYGKQAADGVAAGMVIDWDLGAIDWVLEPERRACATD